ncbi:hypothetical protein B9Z55_004287 [Caenorhabditis nigoni]|uniref:RING-type domain-containing protein n=1 Tax=Caenorhabditis nigoni TaxID=1611254 RepID=A0A2G5UVL6_9PELO|nr:hypothetical protein B9Z55_004287 [Caenorhabditis nigoni]
MDCEFCHQGYNNGNRLPRDLSCGHTFCHQCWIRHTRGGVVICPFDNEMTELGGGSLNINDEILGRLNPPEDSDDSKDSEDEQDVRVQPPRSQPPRFQPSQFGGRHEESDDSDDSDGSESKDSNNDNKQDARRQNQRSQSDDSYDDSD